MMKKYIKPSFELAGATVGFGLIGEGLNSTPLKQAGETTGKFIPVAVNVGMGGYMVKQLKGIGKIKK